MATMTENIAGLWRFFSTRLCRIRAARQRQSLLAPRRSGSGEALRVQARHFPSVLRVAVANASPLIRAGAAGSLSRTFLLFVLAPSLVFFLYALLWQTSGYVAEMRVSVRGAQEQRGSDASSILGRLSAGSTKATVQDSYIVLNYIKSAAIIADLGGSPYLGQYFGSRHIDFFSRMAADAKIEDLVKYWQSRVTASVDTVSGILTVDVVAYCPEDARKIATDILRLSEKLVNEITIRSRTDALARARTEVDLAADKLSASRDRLTEFRDRSAVIDPASRAQAVGEMIGKLTLERIGIENSLMTLQDALASNSPTQRVQRAKLAAIDQQINELKTSLTGLRPDAGAVSAQLASFERLKLDEQFSERMYTIAQNSFQRARQELEKQQFYLVVVVPPSLPESVTYPRVTAGSLLLFAALFVFWAILALIIASIKDQTV